MVNSVSTRGLDPITRGEIERRVCAVKSCCIRLNSENSLSKQSFIAKRLCLEPPVLFHVQVFGKRVLIWIVEPRWTSEAKIGLLANVVFSTIRKGRKAVITLAIIMTWCRNVLWDMDHPWVD